MIPIWYWYPNHIKITLDTLRLFTEVGYQYQIVLTFRLPGTMYL